jgi:hypothetical protein
VNDAAAEAERVGGPLAAAAAAKLLKGEAFRGILQKTGKDLFNF